MPSHVIIKVFRACSICGSLDETPKEYQFIPKDVDIDFARFGTLNSFTKIAICDHSCRPKAEYFRASIVKEIKKHPSLPAYLFYSEDDRYEVSIVDLIYESRRTFNIEEAFKVGALYLELEPIESLVGYEELEVRIYESKPLHIKDIAR